MEVVMKEVAPNVYVESSYPPYNLVLIKTGRGGIVVDCPPNPLHGMNWLEKVRATVDPIQYVVLPHADLDRQMATVSLDVPIIATEAMLRAMHVYDEDRTRKDFVEHVKQRYPEEASLLRNLAPQKPTIAFNETFTLYADTLTFHFEVVEGGGPGSLWVLIPELELLLAGDTVVVGAVPPLHATPDSKAWLNTMTALAHMHTVKSIVPGRGKPFIARGEIESQREFMRVMRRAARTLAHKGNGLSLSQTAQELGQTFFNQQGQKAVKVIKAGLENLIAEVEAADAAEADQAPAAEGDGEADAEA
jgi:glyoxylase-like metal-dependent hydrolase (beta-lactamase superfamily II)